MLEYLDALPDMRVSGVQGVLGVQPRKTGLFERTPAGVHDVCSSVQAHLTHTGAHRAHSASTPRKAPEIRHSTPCTPCTPKNGKGVEQRASADRNTAAGPTAVVFMRRTTWLDHAGESEGFPRHPIDEDAGDPAANENFMRGR